MSYRLSLIIPHYKLASVLASLPRNLKFEVERLGDEDTLEASVDRMNGKPNGKPATFVLIGPKDPKHGSLSDKIAGLLMALEGKHGAGKVTRALLTEAMKKAKMTDGQLSTALSNGITSGYFKQEVR